jgi:hypothetical protein
MISKAIEQILTQKPKPDKYPPEKHHLRNCYGRFFYAIDVEYVLQSVRKEMGYPVEA